MGGSQELYDRLSERVMAACASETTNIKQVVNLIWVVVGILGSGSIALSKIANYLPGEAEAESRVTHIRRWLNNGHVNAARLYEQLLAQVLAGWRNVKITVVVDGTMVFGDRWQVYRLSLVHGYRAVPLAWTITQGTGVVKAKRLQQLFERAASVLAPHAKHVTLLADRGFRGRDWAELCASVGWRYRLRIPKNTRVVLPSGQECRIDQLGVQPGEVRCYQGVRLTRAKPFLTNLVVTWSDGDRGKPELVAVITGQRASPKTLRQYARRMDIEQSFRDDKSGGFDMAHTRLIHPDRLERLLLTLAIATLWCHELGEHVLESGEGARRQIDPGPRRELSLFQLGLRWIKRCLAVMLRALPCFRASLSNLKLAPVAESVVSFV